MNVVHQALRAKGPGWLGIWAALAAHARGLAPAPQPDAGWWRAAQAALAPSKTGLLDGPVPPGLAFRLVAFQPLAAAAAEDPGLLGDAYAAASAVEERRAAGRFFTPREVVAAALRAPLSPGDRVLDLACGGGRFLLGARAAQPAARLTGVEIDPVAASVCRAALWIAGDGRPAELRVSDPLAEHAAGRPPLVEAFERVLGNPPYRAARRGAVLQGDEADYRRRFETAEGQLDPYVLFLELGLKALTRGGELDLVVPDVWASNRTTGRLRALLLGRYRLVEWIALPPDAFGAGVDTVLLRVRHEGPSRGRVPVTALDGTPRGAVLPDPRCPDAPLPLAQDAEDEALLTASQGWTTLLSEVAEITRGVNPYHHERHRPEEIAARIHHAEVPRDASFEPELRGRDLAGPYRLWPSGEHWIRYGPWLREPRDPRFHEGPRILVRKILGPTLCGVFLSQRYVADQSVYIARLREDQPWPPGALLACLNSALVARLLRVRHQEHATRFPQLKLSELRAVPLPPVDPRGRAVEALARAALAVQLLEGVQGAALAAAAGEGPDAGARRQRLRRQGWPTEPGDRARAAELSRRKALIEAAVRRLYLGPAAQPAIADAPGRLDSTLELTEDPTLPDT